MRTQKGGVLVKKREGYGVGSSWKATKNRWIEFQARTNIVVVIGRRMKGLFSIFILHSKV